MKTLKNTPSKPKANGSIIRFLAGGWIAVFKDVSRFADLLQSSLLTRKKAFFILLLLILLWFIYVPIHELLHVAGCTLTGGSVTELVMGKEYGAEALSRIFPFIVPQSTQYAGRLTGFSPSGDIGYLITDLAPFVLAVPGVILLRLGYRSCNAWLIAPGLLLGLSPFMNLTGDFFEIGTIVSTRIASWVLPAGLLTDMPALMQMRSDDIFRLIGEISNAPADYGFRSFAGGAAGTAVMIGGLILGLIVAGWIYAFGSLAANRLILKE